MSYTTPTNPLTPTNRPTLTAREVEAAQAIGVAFAKVFLAVIRAHVR